MASYAFRGNKGFIEEVAPRLEAAGFSREGEVELADITLLFYSSMSELEDIYFGDEGIVQRMRPESVIVDLSPATPNFAKEASAIATLSNLSVVEAPLSVKNMALEAAFSRDNLSCFTAGDEDVVQAAAGVDGSADVAGAAGVGGASGAAGLLNAIFGDIRHVGGAGSAQLAHAAATLQRVAELVSAIESNALFKASRSAVSSIELRGIDPEATSPEAYFVLKAIGEGRFKSSFTCEMLYGELVAAIMAADDYELIMPQAEAASHLLELIAVIGGAEMSPAALALVYGSEEECAEHGLDWSRAQVFYGEPADEHDDMADGFGSFDDYDGYDDYSDDPYGEDPNIGFGYSSN